jgi:hypothetical protein
MLNEGVTDDPTAALAAAALATIQESMATGETEAEAGAEAAEGQAEALNSLAEKVSSIIASDYGMKMGRDVVKEYLMKNLLS